MRANVRKLVFKRKLTNLNAYDLFLSNEDDATYIGEVFKKNGGWIGKAGVNNGQDLYEIPRIIKKREALGWLLVDAYRRNNLNG